MKNRAFTMMEILVSISIILIVAACLAPVIKGAKQAAQRQTSVHNLRQVYYALSIYRSDWDGAGQYGDYAKMGLPRFVDDLGPAEHIPRETFHSGCPQILYGSSSPGFFFQMWVPEGTLYHEDWASYARQRLGNSVLLTDVNCDFDRENFRNPYFKHRGIGLYEAGQIRMIVNYGLPLGGYSWWNSE